MNHEASIEGEPRRDPALAHLDELREETMREAWGPREHEVRRRIVVAAMIFGEQFDHQLSEESPNADHKGAQRLLMAVINASIDEFARREKLEIEDAAGFMSELETRDLVLEFNEVLEARENNPDKTLDELLKDAVDSRLDKARWADHWTSG
ncbi:MAG: hypothetical protein WA982_02660 [Rubrobacteraceae bacterium]